ncbi:metal-sulfur cluster assembly factor [Pseudonocardia sp. NPDC049635]|uniref:metal-sulfur cluster assembly factor n=1 Tax=Pseudonocardia sp. NPDC049635 TaxID=3155506 RepID=UPI003408FD32
MTATSEPRAAPVLTAREPRARITPDAAQRAIELVRDLRPAEAVDRLRRVPGNGYEQVARVIDAAVARAERAGIRTDQLVVVGGTVVEGDELLRENRKLGAGTWFTVPTARVEIRLQAAGLRDMPTVAAAVVPAPGSPPRPPDSVGGRRAEQAREALYDVLDPDLGVNVVDLGFVRDIVVDSQDRVRLVMTLTSAACPLSAIIEEQLRRVLLTGPTAFAGLHVEWEWRPGWSPLDISEDGREQLRAIGFSNFTPTHGKG